MILRLFAPSWQSFTVHEILDEPIAVTQASDFNVGHARVKLPRPRGVQARMTADPSAVRVPPSATLDYVPSPPLRRRRLIRRGILLVTLVGVCIAGYRWGPQGFHKALFLYHQPRCLAYTAPPEQVVFDSDPARVAILAQDPNFVISGGCAFRKPPADWQAVCAGLSPIAAPTSALLFLHERTSGGIRRLIAIDRRAGVRSSPLFLVGYDVEGGVIEPATLTRPAREIPFAYVIRVVDMVGPLTDLRIYAGQPDPADASRFTIRYEFGGKTHTVEGHVATDGRIDFQHIGG
jgi:hypothetical protein